MGRRKNCQRCNTRLFNSSGEEPFCVVCGYHDYGTPMVDPQADRARQNDVDGMHMRKGTGKPPLSSAQRRKRQRGSCNARRKEE